MSTRATPGLALLVLLGVGCHKKPQPLTVSAVTVAQESLAAAPALGMGAAQMKAAVVAALNAHGAHVLRPGEEPRSGAVAQKVRAEVASAQLADLAYADGGAGHLARVEVVLEASRRGAGETRKVSGTGVGRAPAPPDTDLDGQGAAFARAFARGLGKAAAQLMNATAARALSTPALEKMLRTGSDGQREAAADVLVDRGVRAVIPALIQELQCPEDSVRLKAIGELVELKAKSAAPALIELAERRRPMGVDPRLQVQIIYALGSIGGRDAQAYLYTMASGHPDPRIRQAAQEATHQLEHDHAQPPHTP